jgi:ribonuclease P protein subunit RPR2
MRRGRKPVWQQKIARERIQILFNLAEREIKKHPERSRRYVELARKIGLRYNVRLPKDLKRKFCKKCNTILIPGYNCKVRLEKKKKTIAIYCLNCNSVYRHPWR